MNNATVDTQSVVPNRNVLVPYPSIQEMLEALERVEALSERKYIVTSYTALNAEETRRP